MVMKSKGITMSALNRIGKARDILIRITNVNLLDALHKKSGITNVIRDSIFEEHGCIKLPTIL